MRPAEEEAQEPLRHWRLTAVTMRLRAADVTWHSPHELRSAAAAAQALITVMQRAASRGQTVPGFLLGGRHPVCWAHYPANDAYDTATGYRYYYHTHQRPQVGEHGHFHLFRQASADAPVTHLVGIAVDDHGLPMRLFTTNQWVTDERVQPAPQVLRHLSRFRLERPLRYRPVHDWLRALVTAFRPQLRALLFARDARLRHARRGLLADRRTEVLSAERISLQAQIRSIDSLIKLTPQGAQQ